MLQRKMNNNIGVNQIHNPKIHPNPPNTHHVYTQYHNTVIQNRPATTQLPPSNRNSYINQETHQIQNQPHPHHQQNQYVVPRALKKNVFYGIGMGGIH